MPNVKLLIINCGYSVQSFASAIISEIQERFPDRPLLNSMKIFDHTNWPNNRESFKLTIFVKNGLDIKQ
jgi:hypothetical protein